MSRRSISSQAGTALYRFSAGRLPLPRVSLRVLAPDLAMSR